MFLNVVKVLSGKIKQKLNKKTLMKLNDKSIKEIIEEAFAKINQFEDGNTLFYQKFHKSRAVVSTWKASKVVPSDQDIGIFIKTASEVIKELSMKKEKAVKENSKLMNEFNSLISA